jgi:hypothetical protein
VPQAYGLVDSGAGGTGQSGVAGKESDSEEAEDSDEWEDVDTDDSDADSDGSPAAGTAAGVEAMSTGSGAYSFFSSTSSYSHSSASAAAGARPAAARTDFRFGRRVSPAVVVSAGGLALRRTVPPSAAGAAEWRGGLLEPVFDSSGRAYVEFEVMATADGGCGALLGVTAEEEYPALPSGGGGGGSGTSAGRGLFMSPLSHLYFCRNSSVVCGDEV